MISSGFLKLSPHMYCILVYLEKSLCETQSISDQVFFEIGAWDGEREIVPTAVYLVRVQSHMALIWIVFKKPHGKTLCGDILILEKAHGKTSCEMDVFLIGVEYFAVS